MNNIYVVYDKKTGRVVHTASFYALGNDEAIAWPEDEVRAVAARDAEADEKDLAVARAPSDFDPRDRGKKLAIELKKGTCIVTDRAPRRRPKKAKAPGAR